MQPEQSGPDYSFIMNPTQQPKKTLLPGGNSKKTRIIIVSVIGVVLVLGALIAFSFISNLGKGDAQQLLKLVQTHTELTRVADIGTEKAQGQTARNLAATAKLTLQSYEEKVLAIVNKSQKVSPKQLTAAQDEETDETLTRADQNNRFDEAFLEIFRSQALDYRKQLQAVYNASTSKQDKEVLSDLYKQVGELLPEETDN